MYSKGTFVQSDPEACSKANYESKFVLTLRKEFTWVGVCYFDVSTF
jgi:hypothetical protein